jgi:single-stranded DNA-specific DHH superfamily exonuclease
MFFFLLKGSTNDVQKSIKILTRIKDPYEILNQTSAQGKFLFKRFEKINKMYEELLDEAKKSVSKSRLLLFNYTEKKWSFTTNLANELAIMYPKKVIVIARKKGGKMKCSIRAQVPIVGALTTSIEGLDAYGGGHPNACGSVIDDKDWDEFLKRFKEKVDVLEGL